MNRNLLAVFALAVAVGTGWVWYSNQTPSTGISLAAASAQDASTVDKSIVDEMSVGNPDAKVTVIEYASFTCPHCRSFHEETFTELKKNYIDTGKINFIYREVYFDRFGLWAGMVARCGGASRYFGLADLIFESQSEWLAGGDPTLIVQNLRKIGRTAGLNDEQLDVCLNDSETAQALVAAFQENTTADDVTSTPSFIVDGVKYGNMSYSEFATLLDEKLGE